MEVTGTIHTKVTLDNREVTRIIRQQLYAVMKLSYPNGRYEWYSVENGFIRRHVDYGDNRGGVELTVLREVTELDIAVFRVLKEL